MQETEAWRACSTVTPLPNVTFAKAQVLNLTTNTMTQDIEKYIDEIEDYVGGNIETTEQIDRMVFTVFLRTTLTKVAEEARRGREIELRTKYIVVSKDVQAQHERQIIEEARRDERERIVVWAKGHSKFADAQPVKCDSDVRWEIHCAGYREAIGNLIAHLSDK